MARARAAVDRRDQLLDAARVVLSEQGFERATVSSIAARAGCAQGTFYLYFDSKEELLEVYALEVNSALGEATGAALQGRSVRDGIPAAVEAAIAAAKDYGDVLAIANRGLEAASPQRCAELTAPWREPLCAWLRERQAAGEAARDFDPEAVATVIRDILDRTVKAAVLHGQDAYPAHAAQLVLRALQP